MPMKETNDEDPVLMTRKISRSFLHDGQAVLNLDARLPEIKGAVFLNSYYKRLFRQLAGYCAHELAPDLPVREHPLKLDLEYRVRLMTPGLLSLTLELIRRDGRPMPAARFGAVWSRSAGVMLPLRAFSRKKSAFGAAFRTGYAPKPLSGSVPASVCMTPGRLSGRESSIRRSISMLLSGAWYYFSLPSPWAARRRGSRNSCCPGIRPVRCYRKTEPLSPCQHHTWVVYCGAAGSSPAPRPTETKEKPTHETPVHLPAPAAYHPAMPLGLRWLRSSACGSFSF